MVVSLPNTWQTTMVRASAWVGLTLPGMIELPGSLAGMAISPRPQRGPLASDLRVILAALRVASDIERIGDYAANIAKRSLVLNQSPPLSHTRGLDALGRMAAHQLRDVLRAYQQRDGDDALRVRDADAELDALYTGLFRELLTYMMEDPRAITPCTHLLFMAKNLERIGDHATNIAENVWFLLHGDTPLPPRNKRDDSLKPVA